MQEQQHASQLADRKLANMEKEMARAAKHAKSELRQRKDENADLVREVKQLQDDKDGLNQQLTAANAALKAALRPTPRGMPVSVLSASCLECWHAQPGLCTSATGPNIPLATVI